MGIMIEEILSTINGQFANGLANFIDSLLIMLVGIPFRSQGYKYKGKHEDYVDSLYHMAMNSNGTHPNVTKTPIVGANSPETYMKNNAILNVATTVTNMCYLTGWFNLFWQNDA